VPHAGVLSTHTFLNRYMTTNTNLNRHRAAMVYQKFLDIDIQGLQSTIVGQDTALPSNPTLAGKSCKVCHAAMDPLAAGFTKWAPNGQVRRGRVAHVCTQFLEGSCAQDSECSTNEICYENKCVNEGYQPDLCVRPIGHRGVQLPANQERAPLRWMAQQLAQDPRFASTTVKTLLGLLTGRAALAAPADPRDPSYGAQTRAYLAQEAEVARVTPVFVDSGYNLKTAITEIVAGPWFRAIDAPAGLSPLTEEGLLAGRVGGGQLLTPEELNARIRDLTGFPWITIAGRGDSLLSAKQGYLTLYGGLDSDTITRRTRDPFPVAANVARRMANEMACLVVPQDLAWLNPDDRRFFAAIDMPPAGLDANFQPMDGLAIEETIEWLHALLLNESAPPGSEAFEETYNLLLTVWQAGRQRVLDGTESANLPARCRATKDYLEGVPFAESSQPGRTAVSDDATYAIRAWMAVVSYLLSDGRFLLH
jgi:hypothetical protein